MFLVSAVWNSAPKNGIVGIEIARSGLVGERLAAVVKGVEAR